MTDELRENFEKLKKKYSDDKDALDVIARAEEDVAYYERRGELDKVQPHFVALEAFLYDWY